MSIYDIEVKDAKGNKVSMEEYRGKVLLIVNTATGCGFTPQYKGLQELYVDYQDKGFEVLDFPCNQFMNQAPGSNDEIVEFCQLNYGTTFKIFSKIKANGAEADPIFQYIKKQAPGTIKSTIKWNFTKFLVDRDGRVVERFSPQTNPNAIRKSIEELL